MLHGRLYDQALQRCNISLDGRKALCIGGISNVEQSDETGDSRSAFSSDRYQASLLYVSCFRGAFIAASQWDADWGEDAGVNSGSEMK